MTGLPARYRDGARRLLAAVRLVNGVVALLAPQLIVRRFEKGGQGPPVAHYALRMFGIRTILVGLDLLRKEGPERAHAIRVAPIIHASDTVAATLAACTGKVPGSTGPTIVAISAMNTLLALLMQGDDTAEQH